jgi:hypothetical protein
MCTEKTEWDFIEEYLLNYHSSQEVSDNDLFLKILEGEIEEGSSAESVLNTITEETKVKFPLFNDAEISAQVQIEVHNRLNRSLVNLYEEAIRGFRLQNK